MKANNMGGIGINIKIADKMAEQKFLEVIKTCTYEESKDIINAIVREYYGLEYEPLKGAAGIVHGELRKMLKIKNDEFVQDPLM